MWHNVDNVIQKIESKIDFHSHTTDLYYITSFSREDGDCSHQYVDCIKDVFKMKKPFGVDYMLTLHCYSINEYFSKLQCLCQSRNGHEKNAFATFFYDFFPPKKSHWL